MSDITANIVVQPFNLGVTIEQPTLTVQPEAINLSVYAGGFAQAAGNNGTVQYNNGGVLAGIPSVFWTGSQLNLGNTNNITISGGSPNYALITDGAGNLSWGDTETANYAAFAGNVTIAAQPNITSLGNLTSVIVLGTSNLGNLGNVKITGGTNGYVLQTDGAGNLDWTAMTGGGGNGSPGGANTQIQYNDNGLFGGTAGFTFNEVSGNVSIPGNLTVVGNISGTVTSATNANYANFAGNAFAVDGANVSGAVANATFAANAGNANFANSATVANSANAVAGANVTGAVANATFATTAGSATTAGTVTTAAQPNITSVGTLTSLSVGGTITAINITANTGIFTGNAAGLTNISGGNVTGQVGNALVAGTVYTNAQPNITSVGTLTELSTGNLSVSGTTSIFEALENVAIIGAQTGTYNFDLLDGSIQYSTANATANITLNFRGNSTTLANAVIGNAKAITSTYLMTTGTTPYTITAVAVDSSLALPVKWVGGTTPIPIANNVTAYTYTVVKTSTTPTYTIFGSATRYA
jgi:hypothetical protein